ncbi:MAG: hypothetical protein GWN93_27705 [Deltaproteobacteria bacterium]|nr:hypothetical protein [Deltaproteobacteria bacterium]
MGASSYPLTIYFDGTNHDLISESFWNACDQNGRWTIIHPTKYLQTLQLSSVRENIRPVDGGNITVFDLEFIESLELAEIISGKQLSAIASAANVAFTALAVAEFAGSVITESAAAVQTLKSVGQIIGDDIASSTSGITTGLPELRNAITGRKKALTNSIAGFDVSGIAQGISDLNQAGIQAYEQLQQAEEAAFPLDSLLSFIDAQLDGPIDNLPVVNRMRRNGDPAAYNQALICEIAIGTGLSAQADLIGRYEYRNRSDAITAISRLQSNFDRSMSSIETVQGYFDGLLLENQYVGYVRTYNQMRQVFANSVRAVLENIVSLPTTRTYKTDRPSSPIIEFAKHYTGGDIDTEYDKFLSDNDFTGSQILYLEPGTEVTLYARAG